MTDFTEKEPFCPPHLSAALKRPTLNRVIGRLSPSKKIGFICFNESPLKMMKNVFVSC